MAEDTVKRVADLEPGDRCHGPVPIGDHGIVASTERIDLERIRIVYEGGKWAIRPPEYEMFIEAPFHAPGRWS